MQERTYDYQWHLKYTSPKTVKRLSMPKSIFIQTHMHLKFVCTNVMLMTLGVYFFRKSCKNCFQHELNIEEGAATKK